MWIPLLIAAAAAISLALLGEATRKQPGEPLTGSIIAPGQDQDGPSNGPGPQGFGPGTFFAPRILEEADANKDGRLSPGEAARAAEKLVRDAAPKKQGSVDTARTGDGRESVDWSTAEMVRTGPRATSAPGTFGARILEAADANKDGRLSRRGSAKAPSGSSGSWTGGKSESPDADALASAINRQMGPPPGGGPGGPGGPMGQKRRVQQGVRQGWRRTAESRGIARRPANPSRKTRPRQGPEDRGSVPLGNFGRGNEEPAKPGERIAPRRRHRLPGKPLYEPTMLRTLFLDFEEHDWEQRSWPTFTIPTSTSRPRSRSTAGSAGRWRPLQGASSFLMCARGPQAFDELSLDFTDPDQRLEGFKTLNLLNSPEDASFLHTFLFSKIARHYIPAPRANFVRLVINGESWGVYANVQQFDKVFLDENFGTAKGARGRCRGTPGRTAADRTLGTKLDPNKNRFEIKSIRQEVCLGRT